MPKIEAKFRNEYMKAYDNAINAGKTLIQAKHIARQKGTGIIDKYWKDTSNKFGFEYIARNKSYEY